jgi:ubiquinone/menaquinone biosynthesis C-methylase UbiE
MARVVDPAGTEVRILKQVINWRSKQVIEIGCGDGRLTQRLASLGAEKILALDPDAMLVRNARKRLPKRFIGQVRFRVGQAEHLPAKAEQFDLAVFSWVL